MNAFVALIPNAVRSRLLDRIGTSQNPPTRDSAEACAAAPWLYRSEGFAEDLDDSYAAH